MATYYDKDAFKYSIYKDKYFNLMAILVNPGIEKELDAETVSFICNHPLADKFGKLINGEPVSIIPSSPPPKYTPPEDFSPDYPGFNPFDYYN